MSNELWVALCGLITTVGGSFATWFFTRKKYNSEVDSQVIANMKESLDFYKKLSDDNKARLEEVLEGQKTLRAENAKLLEETQASRAENAKLQEDVNDLRDEVTTAMKTICYDFSCSHRIKTSIEAKKIVKDLKKETRKPKVNCKKKDVEISGTDTKN